MARTPAQRKSLESKALASDNKSEGMRSLFDAGYSVTEVKQVFNAPYGYVYGVALRHGVVATAASRRAPRKVQAARPAKAAAKATRATRSSAREQKAAPAARSSKGRAQQAPVAKRGRGRPAITDPKVIAQRSPDAQRAARNRAKAGASTVVVSPLRAKPGRPAMSAATVRKVASANGTSAVSRVAAKLQAKGR